MAASTRFKYAVQTMSIFYLCSHHTTRAFSFRNIPWISIYLQLFFQRRATYSSRNNIIYPDYSETKYGLFIFAIDKDLLSSAIFYAALIIMASDISPNPGWTRTCHRRKSPVSTSTRNSECLSLNARSLMNHHTKNNAIISNLNCFQDLVYSENADLVEVCETWLNDNIEDLEFLHSCYHILRRDRINKVSGVFLPPYSLILLNLSGK